MSAKCNNFLIVLNLVGGFMTMLFLSLVLFNYVYIYNSSDLNPLVFLDLIKVNVIELLNKT